MSRIPPALSAPAMPRKMVQSSPSIFSQIRRAVARLRPWKETFSIRESISPAARSGVTANGSTGTRRKRDLFGMRGNSIVRMRGRRERTRQSRDRARPGRHARPRRH